MPGQFTDSLEIRHLMAAADIAVVNIVPDSPLYRPSDAGIHYTVAIRNKAASNFNGYVAGEIVLTKDTVLGNGDDIETQGGFSTLFVQGNGTASPWSIAYPPSLPSGAYYLGARLSVALVDGTQVVQSTFVSNQRVWVNLPTSSSSTVMGTAGRDTIKIYDVGDATVVENNGDTYQLASTVTRLFIDGLAGNDYIQAEYADHISVGITGSGGNDTIIGTMNADELSGGTGKDRIYGAWGNDYLLGGAGNDTLWGDDGNDTLSGAGGNDKLMGNGGADYCIGGIGNDLFDCKDGPDTPVDTISGGAGNDRASVDPSDIVFSAVRI